MRRKRRTGGASTRVSASVAILRDFQFSSSIVSIVRILNHLLPRRGVAAVT